MKRILSVCIAAAVAGVMGWTSTAEAQQLRVGFISTQRVLAEAPGAQAIQQQLEQELSPFRAEIDTLEARLQRQQDDLRRQEATLSAQARQQRQTELQQAFAAYQQRVAQIEQIAGRRQQELVGPFMERIRGVLEAVRREGNFSFIIDPPEGMVVAFDPALDVTDRVIQQLRTAGN